MPYLLFFKLMKIISVAKNENYLNKYKITNHFNLFRKVSPIFNNILL